MDQLLLASVFPPAASSPLSASQLFTELKVGLCSGSGFGLKEGCCWFDLLCGPLKGFPDGASGKEAPPTAGDIREAGLIPGSGGFPEGWHSDPLQHSCLENPRGQRSLVDYSP